MSANASARSEEMVLHVVSTPTTGTPLLVNPLKLRHQLQQDCIAYGGSTTARATHGRRHFTQPIPLSFFGTQVERYRLPPTPSPPPPFAKSSDLRSLYHATFAAPLLGADVTQGDTVLEKVLDLLGSDGSVRCVVGVGCIGRARTQGSSKVPRVALPTSADTYNSRCVLSFGRLHEEV